jgi:hypothetical protein
MALNTEASAALVFLILYAVLFVAMAYGYVTRRIRLRSRHTIIFFHVAIRLASQATGLAFGILGYSATNLLVAYFILGTVQCVERSVAFSYRATRILRCGRVLHPCALHISIFDFVAIS